MTHEFTVGMEFLISSLSLEIYLKSIMANVLPFEA